jgi:Lrp/AsnC family transcriptional regulator for asnA, asnC and gidA
MMSTDRGEGPQPRFLRLAASLSELDLQLVARLQIDGRQSFAQLARDLGVTQKRVRRHVAELCDSGVIRITTVTDPKALGYEAGALLGITLDGSRSVRQVVADITGAPRTSYVTATTGRFPIYAEVYCKDNQELLGMSGETIPEIPGVGTVEVFPYLRVHYQQAQLATARSLGAPATGVRPAALDETDAAILRELTTDGRVPAQHIGQRLGISESQVRARIRAMADEGSMQVMAIFNPLGLEYQAMAWIAVRASAGAQLQGVAEALAELPFLTYLTICAGRFDIFAEVVSDSRAELLDLLDEQIRPLPGVDAAEAAIFLHLEARPLLPA